MSISPRSIPAAIANLSARFRQRGYGVAIRSLWDMSRWLTIVVALYAVLASAAPVVILIALGRMVGHVPAAVRDGSHSAAAHNMVVDLIVAAAFYVVVLLLSPVQSVLSSVVKWRLTYRTQARLMFTMLAPVGIAHLEDPKVHNDVALAQGKLLNHQSADAPMTLVGVTVRQANGVLACAVLGWWHWWLGLGLLVVWIVMRHPQAALLKEQARVASSSAEVLRRAVYLEQLVSRPPAAKESRIFGLGDWLLGQFRSQWMDAMGGSWAVMRRQNRQSVFLACGVLAAFGISAALLGSAIYNHDVSLAVAVILLSMLALSASLGTLSLDAIRLPWMLQALPRLNSLEATLAADPLEEPAAAQRGVPADLGTGTIRFEKVGFGYSGAGTSVLTDLDLVIPAGKSTALVGVNGSGKTTLVKLLARLYEPVSGRITVDGVDIADFPARDWQTKIAVVFQDFAQYPLSVRDNIGFGASAYADDEDGMAQVARLAGADGIIAGLPEGWDTILSRQYPGGVELSGGQWQRIALARALFAVRHGARVLVLDEPTSHLDARGEAEFFEQFADITQGVTTLIISHRFSTVRRADQICVLDGGNVTESGDHDSLLAARGHYARMFELQASRFGKADQ